MELREQAYVTAIARHGSLKQAAAELHISPPTLSIFLSNLEKELGLQLFDRLGKRFVPTEAGRIYLENAREMLRYQERCRAQLGDLRQGSTGSVRFGIHPRRTLYLLAPALKAYAPSHSGIQVTTCEQSSDEMFRLLAGGELDFIVNNQRDSDPALIYQPFYSDRLVMVVRADHPLAADIPAPEDGGTAWVDLKRLSGSRSFYKSPTSPPGSTRTGLWTTRAFPRKAAMCWKIWNPQPSWRRRAWESRSISRAISGISTTTSRCAGSMWGTGKRS